MIGGVRIKLQVAHAKLSYSRAFIIRAYLLQTHEMLFGAHNHAFRGLAPEIGDGMVKSAAQRPARLVHENDPTSNVAHQKTMFSAICGDT